MQMMLDNVERDLATFREMLYLAFRLAFQALKLNLKENSDKSLVFSLDKRKIFFREIETLT